jgi:NAD-dependent DNA ligase
MRYDYIALQEYCKVNNVELSKDYSNEKITRETRVEGKCNGETCDEKFCKSFRHFVTTNAFCIFYLCSYIKVFIFLIPICSIR